MKFVGKIEWLGFNGKVRECNEYETIEELNKVASEELNYGVPISIILYKEHGQLCPEASQLKSPEDFGCLPASYEVEDYEKRNTFLKKLDDESVSFQEFYNLLYNEGMGDWNNVNDRETIKQYIKEQIDEDVCISHMLEAIEKSDAEYFEVTLDCSSNVPVHISDKSELVLALGLDTEDLDKIIV